MLAEAEAERARAERGEASDKRGIGRWVMGKIADAITEQRLLWQLRHVSAARLSHPSDLEATRAIAVAREQLQADYFKHRRWCVIDAVISSAYPLDSGQVASLVADLERRIKRKVKPRVEVDAGLIGGVRVGVGDEVIDGSVRGRLAAMAAALTK